MANFLSLQMTPPVYPVSGPTGDGRSLQNARGEFNLGTQSVGALAAGDTIVMMRVHRNFRVVSGWIKFDALGTGVNVQVGDAGNNARYFAATSAATAGTVTALAETGRDYITPAFTNIILTISGASTNATGRIVVELHGQIENPS